MRLRDEVNKIPGEDGWYKGGNEVYYKVLMELIKHGFTKKDALDTVRSLYWAAASEFGV